MRIELQLLFTVSWLWSILSTAHRARPRHAVPTGMSMKMTTTKNKNLQIVLSVYWAPVCARGRSCVLVSLHTAPWGSRQSFSVFSFAGKACRSNSTCHQLTRLSDYLTDCLPRGNVSSCHTTYSPPPSRSHPLACHLPSGICMKMKMKITFFLVVCLLTFYTLCVPSEKEKEFHFRCASLPSSPSHTVTPWANCKCLMWVWVCLRVYSYSDSHSHKLQSKHQHQHTHTHTHVQLLCVCARVRQQARRMPARWGCRGMRRFSAPPLSLCCFSHCLIIFTWRSHKN